MRVRIHRGARQSPPSAHDSKPIRVVTLSRGLTRDHAMQTSTSSPTSLQTPGGIPHAPGLAGARRCRVSLDR